MTMFDDRVEEFLRDELGFFPTLATALGIPGYDHLVPDLSASGIAAREGHEDAWAARFAEFADGSLTDDECIDRDLILMRLRGRRVMRDFADWRRSPDGYLGPLLYGLFTLFLHRLHPDEELVDAALGRLARLPDLTSAATANLDAELASPVIVERALGQARGAIGYLRADLPGVVEDERLQRRLAEGAEVAATHVERYVAFLEQLAAAARGEFAIGEQRYSALLTEAEGLGYGATALRERGRAAYDELVADAVAKSRDISGSDDWRGLVEQLNADHPATPEEMRLAYSEWTERARAFCIEHDLVTMPEGESCAVVPSPQFQRAVIAVAFYVAPPPFSNRRIGHFFVPYPPDGSTPDQVEQRLATNSYSVIPAVSVHEAYPGHHWHLSWSATRCRRPIRKVLSSAFFSEGWALYTEKLLREHRFFTDPRMELCQIDMRLFRAARIVVDTSLHIGEMSVEEAVDFMSTKASLSRATAQAEVARYCAWPTQATSYLTGALEIERMRTGWPGTAKEFHDLLAGSGTLPLGLAERALSAAASPAH